MVRKYDYSLGQRFANLILTTTSIALFRGRCLVHSVSITGNGAAGQASIYDDPGGNSNEKINIRCATGDSKHFLYPQPVVFENGIFVKPSATTSITGVSWTPAERGTLRE